MPTPDKASLIRFLLTCPMLQRLTPADLDPLASRLTLVRYDDGADLVNAVPHRGQPLRVVAHGQASWEPSVCTEQRGAWMLTRGSCFGLGAVNDWAHEHKLEDTWPRADLDHVRCKAAGPLWVLELAPADFTDVFLHPQGKPCCTQLLGMFPTSVHAPQMVAALRGTPQFSRVATPKLYRLLEHAPTLEYGADPQVLEQFKQFNNNNPEPALKYGEFVTGPALYYVLEGRLVVKANPDTLSLATGELGGPNLFDTSAQVTESAAKSVGTARAVVLTQRALTKMMCCDPGLARSLGPQGFGKVVNS